MAPVPAQPPLARSLDAAAADAAARPDAAGPGIAPAASRLRAAVRSTRLPHWAKNLLVWVPAIAGHRLSDANVLGRTALAFVAFGLVASALYVANDLHDRSEDRRHPRKRDRPIARGELPVRAAWALAAALLAAGFGTSALLPAPFLATLAAYAATSVVYTVALKRHAVADVLVLAALYTVRLYGGAFATGIWLSHWLAIFSLFTFLSLALLKRTSELVAFAEPLGGRDYRPSDKVPLVAMGTTASYIAVLILAFYIVSPDTAPFYAHPTRLWALCPLVLYVLTRLWLLGSRGDIADDPVVFAMKDRGCWVAGALASIVLWIAS